MVNFGQRLKQLRKEAGMTQLDLAKKLNLTKAVISYYEQQERSPSPEVLIKLANIFRVTTDYLLGVEHKKVLDVSELGDDDIHLLRVTIETLLNKKKI